MVWPFGETRSEVTVLHIREKKGNRKARRLTGEEGCYVLKWQLDSTLFIGEIFAIILDYMMDEFLSIERMIEVFDSMCTVHAVLATPRDMRDLRSGQESLGLQCSPKGSSFRHYGAKVTYFRCLVAGYLRERYLPFVKSRNLGKIPEERLSADWWANDKIFLETLFHSRSFCVDCFQYLPLHVYERPAGPGTQVWQPPITNDPDYENPSGALNQTLPPRIHNVTEMLRSPEALFHHLLGDSNDFMQYDPLWRGEPSYEDLLHNAAVLPSYLGGGESPNPTLNALRHRIIGAYERTRNQTAHPVAAPRCFRCLHKRYPMVDIPNAWGLLTETITKAFSEEIDEVEDEGMTGLCETLMDLLPDDMLYTIKLTGRSKNGKTSVSPADRLYQAGCVVPPSYNQNKSFLKKDTSRDVLEDALSSSIEKGEPPQDFDTLYSGSFDMGVFRSCITDINPPIEGFMKNGAFEFGQTFPQHLREGTDFHHVLTEITESFLWHVNKRAGPTLDPWGPPGTHGFICSGGHHSCSAYSKHYSFHPRNGDRKLFETPEDYGDTPFAGASGRELRTIFEERADMTDGTEEEKFAAYEENHPQLAWPFSDHKSMRSNQGVALQYVLLKLLCLLPYKRMVAPRSVHKRSGFGNALVAQRTAAGLVPFIEHYNGNVHSLRLNNTHRYTLDTAPPDENSQRSLGNMIKGMDAIYKGRYQPKGWERLSWFYRLNADIDPTCRSPTRLKLLRGCPASYAESDVHMDRLSFMPPGQLCRIMDLKKDIIPSLKHQLEDSRPKFKVYKPTPASTFHKKDVGYMFSGTEWSRYDKDARQRGVALGGMTVPQARQGEPLNTIGQMINGKELPVILETDVLLLANLFIEFIREFQDGNQTLTWAAFEKRVSEAFFNMWMGPDRVPCSTISVTKNGYTQTFLSQFQSDGVWRYGDDIRHRLWYGCIGMHNPFEENLNSVDTYIFSQKAAKRAKKLDNGLRTDTFNVMTSQQEERHTMVFCNKYTKIGMIPLRRCLGSFKLSSEPGREYEDNKLVTVYGGANVYQLKLDGNNESEIGMEEAVPISSKLTKEARAYTAWYKRDVSENHYRSGRCATLFWNSEFEDEEDDVQSDDILETPDKGVLKKVATPDAPLRPATFHQITPFQTPLKTKKRKSWQQVQDRLGKQWLKKHKTDVCEEGCDCLLCQTEEGEK